MVIGRPIAFTDIESDGLRPDRKLWEIAVIRREVDGTETRATYIVCDVDLRHAEPQALAMNNYTERSAREPGPDEHRLPEWRVAQRVAAMLQDATIVGAQPHFDAETIRMMLDRHGMDPTWHYRLRDVESMTAAYLGQDTGGLAACMEALGLPFDKAVQHTAAGDAQAARAIWDTIMASAGIAG